MCGIAGIVSRDAERPLAEIVGRMTDRLSRRGPDGSGVHAEPGVALGHRRLSIIDLSERGAQPMANEDETVWLTFNGEIYNYRDLRRVLEASGHRFRSDADSEVLVHLYEESAGSPERMLDGVRGMFAFAVWDRTRRRLVVARDRFGIKPLVYHEGDGWLAFASDLDALAACPDVPRRVDWTSVYEYLTLLTVPGPHTIFRDTRCLRPGSMLVVEGGAAREVVYWRLEPDAGPSVTSADEADELVEASLAEAVRLHMVADVEVGAFLSGGVDSGLVCALSADAAPGPLRTFAATFPGEAVDEGAAARDAARRLGAEHTELALAGGFLDGIERVVEAMDQPLALTSAVSLFHLSRLARGHVKVVLTGDGGDEVFGGYNRHQPYPVPSRAAWIPESARPAVGRLGRAAVPGWARRRSRPLGRVFAVAEALAREDAELYAPRLYFMPPDAALALLPAEAAARVDRDRYASRVRALFDECRGADRLSRMLYVDLHTSLADEMLSKVDRMTMAWGLEARVPLLDHHVVEAAMRIAGPIKRQGERGKLPLRRLVARRLGRDAADRPKSGFNSPLDEWLRRDEATRGTFDAMWGEADRGDTFDAGALADLRRGFEAGAGPTALNLFAVAVYDLWARQRGVTVA
jgi:asparagine synthase (glutamine-hydrolysing)